MNSKNRIKLIRSLKQRKYRQKYNKFVCEGAKIALEVLQRHPDRVQEAYGTKSFIESIGQPLNNKLIEVSEAELNQMSFLESNHDALLVCQMSENVDATDINGMAFYLDGVRDPGNMGTIIRICDWFGWNDLFLSPDCVDVYNAKVVQASMGSLFRVNVTTVEQSQLTQWFDEEVRILVADMSGQDYRKIKPQTRSLIVLGNEANGPSNAILNQNHGLINIPMGNSGSAESLNVAVAAGILASRFTT